MLTFFIIVFLSSLIATGFFLKFKRNENQRSLEDAHQRQLIEEQQADAMIDAAENERPFSITKKY